MSTWSKPVPTGIGNVHKSVKTVDGVKHTIYGAKEKGGISHTNHVHFHGKGAMVIKNGVRNVMSNTHNHTK